MSDSTISMSQAVQSALDLALTNDPSVFLLGEDIPDPMGGIFQCTKGLSTKHGTERVRDTPISEQAIIGAAIGAAMIGLRPVAEIMICDFLAVCLDQIANHAAKLRYMTGGRSHVPLTIRCFATGGLSFGAQHSQMLEAWLTHTPGLKVAIPSNPADAKGLLTAAIEDDDPCIIIEPAALYQIKGPVPDGRYIVPFGVAATVRYGADVTVVTYGRQVHDSLSAAEQLAGEIDVEVIDLRSVAPWDVPSVLQSVAKTKRLVVVHQAVKTSGFGAEVAAVVQEEMFGVLTAPVLRVGAADTPVPYAAELEAACLPSVADIVDAIRAVRK